MPSNSATFLKYLNQVFVETGSFMGDGITAALEAGFPRVLSIELSEKYFQYCEAKFKDDPRVKLVLGDSAIALENVIQEIHCPITFWLDGHWSGGDTALGGKVTPLLAELEAIKQHHLKNHTILIDDLREWKKTDFNIGFNEQTLQDYLKSINPDYTFSYENGYWGCEVFFNDILVARVR